MTFVDNLSRGTLEDLFRRIRRLEAGSPMNNSAIGSGGIEVYDGGNINISNGSITINGSLTGGGTFGWSGSFNQTGTTFLAGTTTLSGATTIAGPTGITGTLTVQGATSVTGPLTVTGVTKLNGTTDVGGAFTVTGITKLQGNTTVSGTLDVTGAMATKGTLSVEGVTTLKNDLNVTTGKIKVGAMTLNPSAGGGRIEFSNGSVLSGGTGMSLADGTATASLALSQTAVLRGQGSAVTVALSGIQLTGPLTTVSGQLVVSSRPLAPAGVTANVYWDPVSNVFKVIP